ncbi:hypothetical protein TRICI_003840 [Trichomonascus ciferrii]|uniref:Major facilitator superfamily (MFS) profile domain-containing protein n=1 Tax=Trichomonascus ciferrii TaxID=44093 RepID=A0A642V2S4_9ASCO|nr:hypothetical protein TRICI_003840 [Trichomonascus ciferrii]
MMKNRTMTGDDTTAIPGTVHLVDLRPRHIENGAGHGGEANKDSIVLVPQPSNDPDDPLNWKRSRKLINAFLLFFYTFATGVGGTSVYSVLTPISEDTGITIAQLNTGTGFLFLLAGWSNLIWQPAALTWGRRPIFLLSMLACAGVSEWAAHISEYGEWAACRCLYGVVTAPVEVLPELCMAELFFAHERGAFVGLYMLVLASSNFIAPLIAGFMNNTYGWQSVQHWSACLLLLNFVLAFFFYEDTMYHRNSVEMDVFHDNEEKDGSTIKTIALQQTLLETHGESTKPYWKRLKLWTNNNGRISVKQFFIMGLRPVYIFFAFPVVFFCGTFYGWALAWFNVYNATASDIYSSPPYNFSSSMVGLAYLAPLIGALVGGLFSGPFSDWFMIKLAVKNNGVREPEHRLWGLSFFCVFMTGGLLLWGLGAAHEIHWIGLAFGAAMVGACNVTGGSYSLAYTVDTYKDMSGEALVSVILCRNTISFAFNYAITPWIEHSGLQNTFIAVAMLALGTGLTFLLMIWKGKSLRRLSAQKYWALAEKQVFHHD